MALVIPAVGCVGVRFAEWCDSTDLIVTTLIYQLNRDDENIRKTAWGTAIDQIKDHPWKHSAYLLIKGFSDISFIGVFINNIYRWIFDIFHYLRGICSQGTNILLGTVKTIRERILDFLERVRTFTNENLSNGMGPHDFLATLTGSIGNVQLPDVGNVLKGCLNALFGTFSMVFQWFCTNIPRLQHEIYKYAVQLAGCILFFFERLQQGMKYIGEDIFRFTSATSLAL